MEYSRLILGSIGEFIWSFKENITEESCCYNQAEFSIGEFIWSFKENITSLEMI